MSARQSREHDGEEKLGFWAVAGSVAAAMLGVRGAQAHARDFSKGKPSAYILMGLLFTALFVGFLVGLVLLILHLSGA